MPCRSATAPTLEYTGTKQRAGKAAKRFVQTTLCPCQARRCAGRSRWRNPTNAIVVTLSASIMSFVLKMQTVFLQELSRKANHKLRRVLD